MTAHITDHVRPSIEHCPRDEQHHVPPRTCPVCGREPPAGMVRCKTEACRTEYHQWEDE